jgi:hypothetical protein
VLYYVLIKNGLSLKFMERIQLRREILIYITEKEMIENTI